MSKFKALSVLPGQSVDPKTGEITNIEEAISVGSLRPGSYAPPKYTQQSIDTARETTSVLCEKVLTQITGGRRVRRGNNRGHDINLRDGRKLEAKVGRVGNSAVIKQNQLFDFNPDFWGFLFYRTLMNLPPSYYTSQSKNISPSSYLLRNIDIVGAYIFSSNIMKYYWNTTEVKKGVISTTGIAHKPFAISRAEALLKDEEISGDREERSFSYGRHKFPVKSIGLEL